MSVVYSLYDALVSINVPDEKAKAVIDAMEREMMDKLATKADIENLRLGTKADLENLRLGTKADFAAVRSEMGGEFKLVRQEMSAIKDSLSKDIKAVELDLAHTREVLSNDIKTMATKTELAELGRNLVTQLYLTVGGSVVLTVSILGTLIVSR
jgi:hypothetical protein